MDCVYVSSHAMVEDDYASGQDVDEDDDDDEDEQADDQDFGTAIGDELRANAIEWILTVIPPTDDESDSPRQRKPRIYSDDLHDQLVENPDTRFFAAYLFARYFWTVSTPDAPSTACDSVSAIQGRQEQLAEGERRLVWDFAVAAVALSVKVLSWPIPLRILAETPIQFHRDCLPPLTPVYARDFMAIAPHEMCFEDFELAQRDILDSCAYELATPTPQEFLDELHATLATLRALVGPGRTWACVIGATWEKLLRAVREPDVFRFPVSLLTAAALHEAIADVILKSLADEEARAACVCGCHDSERCDEKSGREETMEATRSVLEDIRDVLGFSEVAMDVCKAWLVPLRNPGSHSGSMRSKYFKEAEEDDDEMEMY
ncbi:hypothetical protein OF83DRAFT_674471 [Amylostereum chailletii]|nr:hypothetical protein OF83DRAFT_674471 [Amylostereum chailletii]